MEEAKRKQGKTIHNQRLEGQDYPKQKQKKTIAEDLDTVRDDDE